MKPREREALFRQMRRHGIARYTESAAGDVSVTFGDVSAPAQETMPAEQGNLDLDLPAGVVDPRQGLAEIYKKRAA